MEYLQLLVVFLIAPLHSIRSKRWCIAVTGVKSRFVVAASGVILILLGYSLN